MLLGLILVRLQRRLLLCVSLSHVQVFTIASGVSNARFTTRRPRGGELQSRQKRKDRESRVQPIGRLLRYAAFRLR
ncbi:hypothetical protein PF008_g28905 [Phytophthora fragariae]|uniref:Secreted protein n=1 Tax=Phytophthora fragariae TaxID=53985 RepID=A0A6G0Q9Y4_9STRA|nr:hypothetical protein PF008_g28905 [Phytophthora fragariae]